MLSQVNHWMDFGSAGIDLILLLRVLTLKLHKTYLFITLACVLAVFFDGVTIWLGSESQESLRVFAYSRFLFAFVYPVAAWDVFEELKTALAGLRRLAISRTVTSLLMMTVFGLLLAGFADSGSDPNNLRFIFSLAVIVWTGSATGSLAFLWVMHRAVRAEKLDPPRNTHVWLIYFELFLAGEVVSCFYFLLPPFLNKNAIEILSLILGLYGIGITAWCILKLRAIPSDVPSTPLSANS
jgi:hypothetical protein